MLVEACKLPDIQVLIKNIVTNDKELVTDIISAEVHRQTQPLKQQICEEDREIVDIKRHKETFEFQQTMLDDLEQHGCRDSFRVASIPENPSHDNTDAAVLKVCELSGSICVSQSGQSERWAT